MESIFYNEIIHFIDNYNFINKFSILSKNNILNKKRKKINLLNVHNNLNNKVLKFSHILLNRYYNSLNTVLTQIYSLKNELLDDSVDVMEISHLYYPRHSKIVVDRFSSSNFLDFYEDNIINLDVNYHEWFNNNNSTIKLKEMICSTYRMTLMDRDILITHFPYAKALIY